MNPIDLIITVCAVLSPTTCEEPHLVFSSERFAAAMRDGGAALHRAVGGRASEMAPRSNGAANIRTPTTRRIEVKRAAG